MSKMFLITFDFKGSADKYSKVFETLKSFGTWWHYMENTWLVMSEKAPSEMNDLMRPHYDKDINVLIIEVGKNRSGWLPQKAWDWIKKYNPK